MLVMHPASLFVQIESYVNDKKVSVYYTTDCFALYGNTFVLNINKTIK